MISYLQEDISSNPLSKEGNLDGSFFCWNEFAQQEIIIS